MPTLSQTAIDICQVGRRARDYCEVASRTAPTHSDVELALVSLGKPEKMLTGLA